MRINDIRGQPEVVVAGVGGRAVGEWARVGGGITVLFLLHN